MSLFHIERYIPIDCNQNEQNTKETTQQRHERLLKRLKRSVPDGKGKVVKDDRSKQFEVLEPLSQSPGECNGHVESGNVASGLPHKRTSKSDVATKTKKKKKKKERISLDVTKHDDNTNSDCIRETAADVVEGRSEGEVDNVSNNAATSIKGKFTVLEEQTFAKKTAVLSDTLPDWLVSGFKVSHILSDTKQLRALSEIPELHPQLVQVLEKSGVTYFFPVQREVIPFVLQQNVKRCNLFYRPNDICVSSPTGSGKTLAYVLPVLHCLLLNVNRTSGGHRTRALVVLPVSSLAVQVFKVFTLFTTAVNLEVSLFTSEQVFSVEQECLRDLSGRVDIIVATPGRLVDHLERSSAYLDLRCLQFLVIDEADRMMEDIKHEWLERLEEVVYKHRPSLHPSHPLTAAASLTAVVPLNKLLFSATLTQNLEQIQKLQLFQPKLFACTTKKLAKPGDVGRRGEEDVGAGGIRQYQVPASLREHVVACKAGDKPRLLLYLVLALKQTPLLCFSSHMDTTHRLFLLLQKIEGVTVKELSSKTKKREKEKILTRVKKQQLDVLVSTDLLARGMDIDGVRCVVSYEKPKFVRTYIHRVGRTARAGQAGTAVTFLPASQVRGFKDMLHKETGRKTVSKLRIKRSKMEMCDKLYQAAVNTMTELDDDDKKNDV